MFALDAALAAALWCGQAEPSAWTGRPGVGQFLRQDLGAVKPLGVGLRDGGARASDDRSLNFADGIVAEDCPLPAAPAFLGGMHRFGTMPRLGAADGRVVLPAARTTYSFHALPQTDAHRAVRHGFGIEWAPDSGAFGVAARFGANGLDSDQARATGDFGVEAKALIAQAPGWKTAGGLAIAVPFGNRANAGARPDAVATPFVGALLTQPGNPWFVQGLASIDLPVGGDDPQRANASAGLGQWLPGSGGWITAWAPAAELHLSSPFSGSERAAWHATVGATALLGSAASAAFGLGVPLRGGALDARAHLAWRY